jgi:hypothetical protein
MQPTMRMTPPQWGQAGMVAAILPDGLAADGAALCAAVSSPPPPLSDRQSASFAVRCAFAMKPK